MPLTDIAIRNAKPGEKPVKLFDGGDVIPLRGAWLDSGIHWITMD